MENSETYHIIRHSSDLGLSQKEIERSICELGKYLPDPLNNRVVISAFAQKLVSNAVIDWVVDGNKQIVGINAFYADNEQSAFLTLLSLSPKCRGMGFANKLIDRMINEAKVRNMNRILLDVTTANIAAISLYQKKGFNIVATIGTKYKMELFL